MRREILPDSLKLSCVCVPDYEKEGMRREILPDSLKLSCVCVPDYEKEGMRREVLPGIVSSLAMSVFQTTRRKACGEKSFQR